MSISTDKAYIFGIVVGGGLFGNAEDTFIINLPYRQWGSYEKNPNRAAKISSDILRTVSPMFRTTYNIQISFETTPRGNRRILCEGDVSELKADLQSYGVTCEGDIRANADISKLIANLADDFTRRRFIAGLADTIGSTRKSHRRFTDDKQIISFELKGYNFAFICDLCRLLYKIKCYPDQILWNHPNFHAGSNCYYTSWTKGHKLRVLLDQYDEFGSFAFSTKVESAAANRKTQYQANNAIPCPEREISAKPSSVHQAEHDRRLPDVIRGGHYIHNRHVCAVLGCEHAPYKAIEKMFVDIGKLVIPFPIICRNKLADIEKIISTDPLMHERKYDISLLSIQGMYQTFIADCDKLIYGKDSETGYMVSDVLQGIAYCLATNDELNGTRVRKKYSELIKRHLEADDLLSIEIRIPDLLTPLVLVGNGRGVLIGARNPRVYKDLVSIAPDNKYKLYVRRITEDDLNEK